MSDVVLVTLNDLDPGYFNVDPVTRKVKLAANAFVASKPVSGDSPVMFTDGETVEPADPTSTGYIYAGLALNGAQVGQLVYTRVIGLWHAAQWAWTPDLPVFVGMAGTLTQTPPGAPMLFSHCIGRAIDATTIQLLPDSIFRIGA